MKPTVLELFAFILSLIKYKKKSQVDSQQNFRVTSSSDNTKSSRVHLVWNIGDITLGDILYIIYRRFCVLQCVPRELTETNVFSFTIMILFLL